MIIQYTVKIRKCLLLGMANDNRKPELEDTPLSLKSQVWDKFGQVESCVPTLFNSDRLCKWKHIEHASRRLTLTAPDELAVALHG